MYVIKSVFMNYVTKDVVPQGKLPHSLSLLVLLFQVTPGLMPEVSDAESRYTTPMQIRVKL